MMPPCGAGGVVHQLCEALGRVESADASRQVTDPRESAARVAVGLATRCKDGGTPQSRSEETRGLANSECV